MTEMFLLALSSAIMLCRCAVLNRVDASTHCGTATGALFLEVMTLTVPCMMGAVLNGTGGCDIA